MVQFKTKEISEIFIPYSKEMGGTADGHPPFTGNGFIKSESDIIPEYECADYLPVSEGARLIEIRKDGMQTLKAVYDDNAQRFVPCEPFRIKGEEKEIVCIKHVYRKEVESYYRLRTRVRYKGYEFSVVEETDNELSIVTMVGDYRVWEGLDMKCIDRGVYQKWIKKEETEKIWIEKEEL